MSESNQCAALTQAGAQCKNSAQEGSIYCYIHRNYETHVDVAPKAPAAPAAVLTIDEEFEVPTAAVQGEAVSVDEQPAHSGRNEPFEKLVHELNQLADQMRQRFPGYVPPDYSPHGLLVALRDNADRVAPGLHLKESKLIADLEEQLAGKSGQDFLDVETWKGLWYVLNVALQSQADHLRTATSERLERLPDTVTELRHELEIHNATDLLAVRTWKNVLRVSRETLQQQVERLRSNGNGTA